MRGAWIELNAELERQTGVNFNYFIHMYAAMLYTQLLLLLLLLLSLIYHLVGIGGTRERCVECR